MTHSDSISAIAAALVAAQSKFTTVAKDAANPFFKSSYATMKAIVEMVRPHLAANGLAVVQEVAVADGKQILRTTIVHKSGEWIATDYPFAAKGQGPQDLGSATTYAKRYGLQAALGVVVADDETDDDGERATGHPSPARNDFGRANAKTASAAKGEELPF